MNPSKFLLCAAVVFSLFLTGCFRTRSDIAREQEETELRTNLQQTILEQNATIEKLQAELGRLQGRIEELEHQRKKEMSSLQSSREGQDKTVSELSEKLEKLTVAQQSLFEEMKKLQEEQLKSLSERKAAAAKPVKAISFEDGFSAYKSKNYPAAISAFRAYLAKFPNGKKSLDARYFLGESLYQTKEYAEAIVEYGVVHEKSLKSQLGRKSTLRIIESFRALGKEKDAKAFAQILVETSPSSAEAKRARKYLK